MDDGYFMGPREVVFTVLRDFAIRIRDETGDKRVPRKCKWYSPDPSAAEEITERGSIPEELSDIEEDIYLANNGDLYKDIHVFNAPIGEPEFVAEVLKDKAHEVCGVIHNYSADLQDGHPQEMWTMLQYSLQHRVTYWLQTSTPEGIKEMAELVQGALLEAAKRTTWVGFGSEALARQRLYIPARLKGGGIRNISDLR
jgi:hypothetical protein